MQSTERQKFEENWKQAFDGAETTPPDRVWNSIELDLAGEESAVMKRRVVLWQRLAAAMLVISLLSGVYAFYPKDEGTRGRGDEVTRGRGDEVKNSNETIVADSNAETTKPGVAFQQPVTENEQTKTEAQRPFTSEQELIANNQHAISNNQQPITNSQHSIANNQQPITNDHQSIADDQQLIAISEPPQTSSEPEQLIAQTTSDKKEEEQEKTTAVVSPLLQQLEAPDEVIQPKKRSRESNLWLALGASAGNYTPNTPTATTSASGSFAGPQANYADASRNAQPKTGTSYSFGMAVGKKFGRVVVQTGVNLGKQQVEYASNYSAITTSNNAKAASADYLSSSTEDYSMGYTNTYTVNSTMEIVSIPVQAGYMIIDRKLGWQFNAGVSPDFFLKNTLVDKSGQRDRFSQSAGDESPYRSLNWSGLMNTELSYRIGTHYRLSLVPGVRYSFNSILKDPADKGRPVIMDVGFRFRYLFE